MNHSLQHFNFKETDDILASRTLNNQQYFEPTISSFKNALVVNYKKVGSRFMGLISSLPNTFSEDKVQLDLYFNTHPRGIPNAKNPVNEIVDSLGNKNYVYTSFDVWENELANNDVNTEIRDGHYEGYNKFKTTSEFLKFENVTSINELLFENPHKEIILVLRNPIRRYVSGAVQILYSFIDELPTNEEMRNEVKFFANIDDNDLRNLYKLLRANDIFSNPTTVTQLNQKVLAKILEYLVERRTDLMFQDIHTQNYLRFYIDFINKVKDKTKIKIIDIDDCMSSTAYKFFDDLRGDDLVTTTFDSHRVTSESNKFIYDFFVKKFVNGEDFWKTSMRFYLEPEYYNYEVLINSSYFINLKN